MTAPGGTCCCGDPACTWPHAGDPGRPRGGIRSAGTTRPCPEPPTPGVTAESHSAAASRNTSTDTGTTWDNPGQPPAETCTSCGHALLRDTPGSPPHDTGNQSLYCHHTGGRHTPTGAT